MFKIVLDKKALNNLKNKYLKFKSLVTCKLFGHNVLTIGQVGSTIQTINSHNSNPMKICTRKFCNYSEYTNYSSNKVEPLISIPYKKVM